MKILFVSPHTDDVELGCGGSLLKFFEEGHEVYWITFSTAEDSVPSEMPRDTLRKEFLEVIEEIGIRKGNVVIDDFKVRLLSDHRQEVLDCMIEARKSWSPDLVIGPSPNDFHQDHQTVAMEMIRAFKNSSSIICYELPWNHTNFNTQLFIRLDERFVQRKCELLSKYRSQQIKHRSYFDKEFVYGMARTRGVQCQATYAEAFEVIRWMM